MSGNHTCALGLILKNLQDLTMDVGRRHIHQNVDVWRNIPLPLILLGGSGGISHATQNLVKIKQQ